MTGFMHEEALALRRRERARCNEAADRTHACLLVGYANAVQYWGAAVPASCTLRNDTVHVCFPAAADRVRSKHMTSHVFRAPMPFVKREYERFRVVLPPVCWAQMASSTDVTGLVDIATSFLRRDHRDKVTTLADLAAYVRNSGKFPGRRKCLEALPLLMEGSDSPPEGRLALMLMEGGFGRPVPNHRIDLPGLGEHLLIDLAYPDRRVGFEYQGGYHADPSQMRRDARRFNILTGLGWTIVMVTADDMATPQAKGRLLNLARTVLTRQRLLLGLLDAVPRDPPVSGGKPPADRPRKREARWASRDEGLL